ncbi:MAG: flagellar basal body L-ring protein FlgH [Proteobacteria bacterium]|nr:flagellar basal body L-ring protein FlgH [Pseudomonadota bacterium]MCP4921725.1 flagellar basal body L-ring protein FlgH [Pseudomonadota bacterium]
MFLLMFSAALAGPPSPPALGADSGLETVSTGAWDPQAARRAQGLDYGSRQVGELITVTIDESSTVGVQASTNTAKDTQTDAHVGGLFGLVSKVLTANPSMDMDTTIGAEGGMGTSFNGTGDTARGATMAASLTCEVLEVDRVGNVRIWGYKIIVANHESQYLVVDAWVRPRDITMDNIVSSDRFAKSTIELVGDGVLDDKQKPGIGQRMLDHAWPF